MMTDIEIAQSVKPKNIYEIAQTAGIDEKYIEPYGRAKAKSAFRSFRNAAVGRESSYWSQP